MYVRQSNVEVAQNESFVSALLWVEINRVILD